MGPNLKTAMAQSLHTTPVGSKCRIEAIDDAHECAPLLRRIGFAEGLEVERLSNRNPSLIICGSCKIAVSRSALESVQVSVLCQEETPGCARREGSAEPVGAERIAWWKRLLGS